jgi:hypothetical protein
VTRVGVCVCDVPLPPSPCFIQPAKRASGKELQKAKSFALDATSSSGHFSYTYVCTVTHDDYRVVRSDWTFCLRGAVRWCSKGRGVGCCCHACCILEVGEGCGGGGVCWGGGTRCIFSVSGIRAQPLPPHVRVSWFQDDAAHHLCLCVFGVCSPEFIDQLWRVLVSLGCAPVFDRLVIPPILITLRNLVFDTYLQEGACRGGACTWCLQLESGGGGRWGGLSFCRAFERMSREFGRCGGVYVAHMEHAKATATPIDQHTPMTGIHVLL